MSVVMSESIEIFERETQVRTLRDKYLFIIQLPWCVPFFLVFYVYSSGAVPVFLLHGSSNVDTTNRRAGTDDAVRLRESPRVHFPYMLGQSTKRVLSTDIASSLALHYTIIPR